MRNPMDDFNSIRDKVESIVANEAKMILFFELSRSISILEELILTDNTKSKEFNEALSNVIVDTLSLLSSVYKLSDFYSFLESRKHWGEVTEEDDFSNHYKCLVEPFYELRCEVSKYMLKKNSGFRVKPLFKLAKFLIYNEEQV